jgi:hypothetical protein
MMNRMAFFASMAAALVLLAASPIKADNVYSTSGTLPPAYLSGSGYTTGAEQNVIAEAFVPTETATLTDALIPLQLIFGGSSVDVVTAYIESSNAGAPSGTILDTLTTTGTITATASLLTYTCTICSQPFLQEGINYFVVLQQIAGADSPYWNTVNPNTPGTIFDNNTDSTSGFSAVYVNRITAFEVDGTPTPEIDPTSGTSALALLAGVVLIFRGRRPKKTVSVG